MTLKKRIHRLEDNQAKMPLPVIVWKGQPVPNDLKPGQEVIHVRWKNET